MMKKRKKRMTNRDGNVAVRKPKEVEDLRIPVNEEDEDDSYDDGGLYEDDIEEDFDDNEVEDVVEFTKATKEQEMAGRLFQERQMRLEAMQRIANLEDEISRLRKEVAETRIQKLKDQARFIENANAKMFEDCGLKEGDQLKPTENGFVIIPKGS